MFGLRSVKSCAHLYRSQIDLQLVCRYSTDLLVYYEDTSSQARAFINLPGINGIQVLKILREDPRTRHIPVMALSANAMPHDIEKGLAAGFFRYLTKPIKLNEFMAALGQALEIAPTPSASVNNESAPS